MKVVLQRVQKASVTINNHIISKISKGLLLLVGFTQGDNDLIINKFVNKIINMRIFDDETGKMNYNIKDIKGQILSVSQFTLYANIRHGKRPSFVKAEKFDDANKHYIMFNKILREKSKLPVFSGIFGANMQVSLINDGPVTIVINSDNNNNIF